MGKAKKKTRVRRLSNRPIFLQAGVDIDTNVEVNASSENTGEVKQPTFSMVAYTGKPMSVSGWRHPVLVDVSGLDATAKSRPIFRDHSTQRIVGHSTNISKQDGKRVLVDGVISGESDDSSYVIATAGKGFPWQASIGAKPLRAEFIDTGKTVTANGGSFEGPLYYVSKSRLSEISFVALGADDDTTSTVAASAETLLEIDMEFSQWLEAMGLNAEELSDDQIVKLQAKFDSEVEASHAGNGEQSVPTPNSRPERPPVRASVIEEAAKEAKYVAEITAAAGGDAEVLADALANQWSVTETKLAAENKQLKAERPEGISAGFSAHTRSKPESNEVITAALCLSMGLTPEELANPVEGMSREEQVGYRGDVRPMKNEVIDAADEKYRGLGLQEACLMLAKRDAQYSGIWGNGEAPLRAAFSTLSLPTVFQEALNRSLLSQYRFMDLKWRSVTAVGSVPDFRETTRFRIHGTGHWETLSPNGELKHGQIEEGDKYTNRAETIGQMNMLTRTDFINDDLGALNNIARMMSTYGALAPELEVFKTLMDNAGNFFSVGNSNLLTGASSAFGYESLKTIHTNFRTRQDRGVSKDAGSKPILDIMPRILLVPAELEIDAQLLMGQRQLGIGGAEGTDGLIVTTNPVYNKYQVVSTAYLSDTALSSGASSTAFYLLADPRLVPAMEIVFLNGRQRPTIENVQPRPEVLGLGFRGWFDFGVSFMDPKGAYKSAGA